MCLQAWTKRFKHTAGRLAVRFADDHGAEAAFKRGVLLNKFAVFLQCRRTDHLQLSPAKGRLEQIGRVDRALGAACADDGVHFVDK